MPLLPSAPAGPSRLPSSSPSHNYEYAQIFKIFLLVLVVAAGVRLAITKFMTKGRRKPASVPTIHLQEKDTKLYQTPLEKDLREHQILERKDQGPPTFQPIYPWTSPPKTLPGPYDPRLYPLPTIRRHSYDPSTVVSEQNATISYTRRVSANSIPSTQTTLHGTVTTSTKGWRRNQWVISGA